MAVLGHAYVEIRALTDKLQADIAKSLESHTGKIADKVGDDLGEKILKSTDDALKRGRLSAPGIDTRDTDRSVGNIVLSLSRLRTSSTGIVRSFTQNLKKIDNALLQMVGNLANFGGGFSGLMMKLDAGGAIIGSLIGPLSALVSGLFAFGSALAPAMRGAAILPGLFSGILVPVLATVVAFRGVSDAIKQGSAAMAGGEKEFKKFQATLEGMPPATRDFVMEFLKIKPAFTEIKEAAADGLFPQLTQAIQTLAGGGFLDVLEEGFRSNAEAVGVLARRFAELSASSTFQEQMGRVMQSNVTVFGNLGKALVNLVSYFTSVADAARPFTEEFTAWIATVTGGWASRAQGNFQGLQDRIAAGVEVVRQLGRIFGNLFDAIGNIARAAQPAGQSLVDSFENALAALERFTGSTAGQERLGRFFDTIASNTRSAGDAINALVREFLKLGENPAFANMLDQLAAEVIPNVATALSNLATVGGPALLDVFTKLTEVGARMSGEGGFTAFIAVVDKAADALLTIVKIPGLAQFVGSLLAIGGAMRAFKIIGTPFVTVFSGIGGAITGTANFMRGLKGVDGAMSGTLGNAGKLGHALRTVGTAIGHAATATAQFVATNARAAAIWVAQTAAVVAHKAALLLSAAATKIVAAGQWLLNAAMSANPIGIIIVAIGALVAAFILLWNNSEGFRNFWIGLWDAIRAAVQVVLDWFTATLVPWLQGVWDGILAGLQALATFFTNIWNAIVTAVTTILQTYITVITTVFTTIWNVIQTIWNAIAGFFTTIWSTIVTTVTTFINLVATVISTVFNTVRNTVTNIFNAVRSFITTVWNNIHSAVSNVVNRISSAVSTAFNNVRNTVTTIFNAVRSFVTTIWNNIYSAVSNTVNNIWTNVTNVFNRIGSAIGNAFSNVAGRVQTAFSAVTGVIRGAINGVIGLVNGAIGALNGVRVTIPSWVPGIGGNSFGISIPKIPRLAAGGVVAARDGGTLALLAEAGRSERVEPLDSSGLSAGDRAVLDALAAFDGGTGGSVRLSREDMDYIVSALARVLWPAARAAQIVNDLVTMGPTRTRMGKA